MCPGLKLIDSLCGSADFDTQMELQFLVNMSCDAQQSRGSLF
jgi:hypothetical protein